METRELINLIVKERESKEQKREHLKSNINNEYILAQLDFQVIKNYDDSIETLITIEHELNRLQDRIIKRNRGEK